MTPAAQDLEIASIIQLKYTPPVALFSPPQKAIQKKTLKQNCCMFTGTLDLNQNKHVHIHTVIFSHRDVQARLV